MFINITHFMNKKCPCTRQRASFVNRVIPQHMAQRGSHQTKGWWEYRGGIQFNWSGSVTFGSGTRWKCEWC